MCRLTFVSRYSNYAIYQAEARVIGNSSEEQFTKGGPETMCRKPLSNLVTLINNKQMRDNLMLSVIKHANLQDNLPFTSSAMSTITKSMNTGLIARLLLMVILCAIFSSMG
uniref:Uncharacterized protein n=1 Tax=Romanomermis culicivorax TaxID=13658 RepID=A0A915JBH1_ROMCU